MTEVLIRTLSDADVAAADAVTRAAFEAEFGSVAEASLIRRLRELEPQRIELVAESGGEVVGHIVLSPVRIETDRSEGPEGPPHHPLVMGLGPMSVRPDLQGQGIGTDLVHAGLTACWDAGAIAVVVLGHASYYPKFGFTPASAQGLGLTFEVPDEAFMLLLREGGEVPAGTVHYSEAFGAV